MVISTGTGCVDDAEVTDALLSAASSCKGGGNIPPDSRAAKAVKWSSLRKKQESDKTAISAYGDKSGPVALLQTNRDVSSVRWHRKGDYFVTVSPKAGAAAVLIHQLSKVASQQPFGKMKGEAQLACFHPQKPFLFVASKEHVRVYHLVKQVMVKRLMSGCRHISSLDVHTSGDHLVVGSLDRRLVWFDMDLANTPYKTLKYHERALRSVGFHPRYPLMASASDDGSIHVFHSMVYSDLMRNPLIVPVKVLRGHSPVNSLGALSMVFHPTQPWLFSCGADGRIHLFQDL
jgi:ribosome biogenesis protein ERB1